MNKALQGNGLTARRLAGGLLLSICLHKSPIALRAEIRYLARRIAGPGERYAALQPITLAGRTYEAPSRCAALLRDWRFPTHCKRALALTMAELRVRPQKRGTA